jgi:hypothetical protein
MLLGWNDDAHHQRIPQAIDELRATIAEQTIERAGTVDRGLTRRRLCACLVGGAAAPAATPSGDHRDAVLLHACATFNAMEERLLAFGKSEASAEDDKAFDRMAEAVYEAQEPWRKQMLTLRATTAESLAARLRGVFLADEMHTPARLLASPYVGNQLLGALLLDLETWLGVNAPGGRPARRMAGADT